MYSAFLKYGVHILHDFVWYCKHNLQTSRAEWWTKHFAILYLASKLLRGGKNMRHLIAL
jgi:hypothetical protein